MIRTISLLCFLSLAETTRAQRFVPNLGPDLPSITVTCKDITVLLRQSTQWTPGRIDFRGTPMTTESSAYGSVLKYPEIGFIGTAHLENEPEDLQSLRFFVDGREIGEPTATTTGRSFRMLRDSKIRGLRLQNTIQVKDNRLLETATITANTETRLDLAYHFMHAWTPTVSVLLAGSDADPAADIVQPLGDTADVNRKFYINTTVDWIAVYEPVSQQFAVSRLLEVPANTKHMSMLWNVPTTYRKYYLAVLSNQTFPQGFHGTWRMITAFGHSERNNWEQAARQLATDLRE